MNPDPIGIGDGVNVYAYCKNDPVGNTDQSGTQMDESNLKAVSTGAHDLSSQTGVSEPKLLMSGHDSSPAVLGKDGLMHYNESGSDVVQEGNKIFIRSWTFNAVVDPKSGDVKSTELIVGQAEGGMDMLADIANSIKGKASVTVAVNAIFREIYLANAANLPAANMGMIEQAEATGNMELGIKAEESANSMRTDLKHGMQKKVSPSARAFSKWKEVDYSIDIVRKKYGATEATTVQERIAASRRIVEASGRTNSSVNAFSRAMAGANILVGTFGVATAMNNVETAPSGMQELKAFEEGYGMFHEMGWATIGSYIAGAAAFALMASNPVGWLVAAVTIGASIAGGYAAGQAGRAYGEQRGRNLYAKQKVLN